LGKERKGRERGAESTILDQKEEKPTRITRKKEHNSIILLKEKKSKRSVRGHRRREKKRRYQQEGEKGKDEVTGNLRLSKDGLEERVTGRMQTYQTKRKKKKKLSRQTKGRRRNTSLKGALSVLRKGKQNSVGMEERT